MHDALSNILPGESVVKTQSQKSVAQTPIGLVKLIALASMTLDHVGIYLEGPVSEYLRIAGRFALPLFAMTAAYQYAKGTTNKKKYIERLAVFAIVSQPFYSVAVAPHLNILFTFSVGLAVFHGYKSLWSQGIIVALVIVLETLLGGMVVDGGAGAILLVIACCHFQVGRVDIVSTAIPLLLIYPNLNTSVLFCWVFPATIALLAFPLLMSLNVTGFNWVRGYWVYLFYPVHMLLIWAVMEGGSLPQIATLFNQSSFYMYTVGAGFSFLWLLRSVSAKRAKKREATEPVKVVEESNMEGNLSEILH